VTARADLPVRKNRHIILVEADMNVQQPGYMDKAAFFAWAEGREGRFELVEHRVVMMAGGSKLHALIAIRLIRALWARLDLNKWVILGSDLGIDVGPGGVRYPDAVVDLIGNDAAQEATAPALIAEVLSPSSARIDLNDKAAEYLRLPSLMAYLVLSQNEPKVWAWVRGPEGFPAKASELYGTDKIIGLAPLGIDLPLSEIYPDFKRP
jgi:Uma2 family endonuclease